MTKDEKAKIHAYNKIIEHLDDAARDGRRREQRRVRIAKRHIAEWYNEGLE